MSRSLPISLQRIQFAKAAEEYLRFLRENHPEHFMESFAQSTQRKIFVESMDLVAVHRPDVHTYSEMLIQWRGKDGKEIRRVVPDNMVVISAEAPKVSTNYEVPLQPAPPFWVLEYVSKRSERKDNENSFDKYEKELKVPYYLMYYPDNEELTLYRRNSRRYVSVKPNSEGRYPIPQLDLELALVDGWIRFWYKGQLLPLPAELQAKNKALQARNDELEQEMAKMRAELERLRAKKNGGS